MEYHKLGNSNLNVSRFCVGCMSFGEIFPDFHQWVLPYKETERIIHHALDLGINFFDTANVYSHGTSEQFLGKALKNVARDKVIIASKVFFNEGGLSKKAILREIDMTLKNLGMDYLDLYIIHRFDKNTPILETMQTLDSLVKMGKVRALGASAMYGYQFMNMQQCAKDNNLTPFVSMQNHYNLLYREDERELIPICRQMNVALTPYSPLASGHLCRNTWDNNESKRSLTDKTAKEKYDSTKDNDIKIVQRVFELSKKYQTTMSNIALAWHFSRGVTSVIIGSTKLAQYDDAIKSLNIKLSLEDLTYLEELYVPHKVVGAL